MSVFNKYREFEQYFEKELKTTPQDFIVMKYKAGSSPNAVQYLYEIVSAEIGKKNRVQVAPFEYYYKQLLKNGLIQLGYKAANQEKVLDNSAIKVYLLHYECRKRSIRVELRRVMNNICVI